MMDRICAFLLMATVTLSMTDLISPFAIAAGTQAKEKESVTRLSGVVRNSDDSLAVGVKVQVYTLQSSTVFTETLTNSSGEFELSINIEPQLVARTGFLRVGTNDSIAIQRIGIMQQNDYVLPKKPLSIKLSPKVDRFITVLDKDGSPVADAALIVQLSDFILQQKVMTDDKGIARFSLPESAVISSAIAWKSMYGLEYRSFVPEVQPGSSIQPMLSTFSRDGETINLGDATTLNVKVVDEVGKPLVGQTVYPWILEPPGDVRRLNCSMFRELRVTTDQSGLATFDWIPKWQSKTITFWGSGGKEFTQERIGVHPDSRADANGVHGTIQVDKLVELSGRVVSGDGQPAPGVIVSVSGESDERHFVDVETDEHGKYKTLVPPNMAYLLTARKTVDSKVIAVADTLTGFAVLRDTPYEAQDLSLREPTMVSGTLKDHEGNAVPDKAVIFYHYGIPAAKLPEKQQLPISNIDFARPMLFHYAKTDAIGKFEMSLGNGEYDVRDPDQASVKEFSIVDGTPVEFALTLKPKELPTDVFSGRVTDANGVPVPNAKIDAAGDSFPRSWKTVTDNNGEFSVKEIRQRKTLTVISADKQLSAHVVVASDVKDAKIVLQPVGMALLTLVDKDGEALPNQAIILSSVIHQNETRGFKSQDVISDRTDEKGLAHFKQLVPGMMYHLRLPREPNQQGIRTLHTFKILPGETYEAKVNVTGTSSNGALSGAPNAYQPPTTEERLKSLLSVPGTPLERFERAISKLDAYQQRLLIVVGDSNGSSLKEWIEIRYNDPNYRKVASDYVSMVFAPDVVSPDEWTAIMSRLNVVIDVKANLTCLIINGKGEVLARADANDLSVNNKLSSVSIVEFLSSHPLELPSARKILDDALSLAKASNKKVIVQETATWCGPCHALTDFMLANQIWEKDYVYIRMDHRMEGAIEIMKSLRNGAEGGIPWFAILNDEGGVLATSNHYRNDRNIGFPSSEAGQEHFAMMLKQTATRLTEDDINEFLKPIMASK